MAEAKETFDGIVRKLVAENEGVTASKMFGSPCGKVKGKAFCCLSQGEMVFKLYGKSHARALTLPGARLFDPGGMNHPMKEWVQVPVAQSAAWDDLAADALEYVASSLK